MPPYRMLYLCSRATECEPKGCERPTAGSKEAAAHNSRSKVLEMLIAMLRVLEMLAVALNIHQGHKKFSLGCLYGHSR